MDGQLKSRALCQIEVELEPPQEIGNSPRGIRMIWKIKGGRVEGERLKGKMLPGGSDWALLRSDAAIDLDIRATILTSDGQLVAAYVRGVVNMAPDVCQKVRKCQSVDPSFETLSEKHACLNKIVGVGVLARTVTGVAGTIYEIL
jgi:hypothetical protein